MSDGWVENREDLDLCQTLGRQKNEKNPAYCNSVLLFTPKSSWDVITGIGLYSSSAAASEGSSAICIIAKPPVIKMYVAGQKIKSLKI